MTEEKKEEKQQEEQEWFYHGTDPDLWNDGLKWGEPGQEADTKGMERLVRIEKACWKKLLPIYKSLTLEEKIKHQSLFESGTNRRFGKPCLIKNRLTTFDFCQWLACPTSNDWNFYVDLVKEDVSEETLLKGLAVWFFDDWLANP